MSEADTPLAGRTFRTLATRIAIEPMPFSIIDTVPAGAALARAAAHPAVGLLIDAWHGENRYFCNRRIDPSTSRSLASSYD
ncbi:MAG: hypothetical protein U5N53_26240 [Mycobacterium sp.]|nr:hypothetical protein [Mycobacterium sp.]